MDAHKLAEAWADEMLQYVATVRPDLPDDERELQRQSLVRFRTFQFERVEARFEDTAKRGILFEALVLCDPRYPPRSALELQVRDYLFCSLWYDPFEVIPHGRHSIPDDIFVEVGGDKAVVTGLVEVKLDLTHTKVQPQLRKHVDGLSVITAAIEQRLSFDEQLPDFAEVSWPHSVNSLVLPDDYDRVLFKPAEARFVEIKVGWMVIPALFSRREVRVIADFLWHLRKEALPIN